MDTTTDALALTPDATLQEIIAHNPFSEDLLTTIGVNFTHSDKTLRQLCVERKWSEYEVLDWIITFQPGATIGHQAADREIVAISRSLLNNSTPRVHTLARDIQRDLRRVHDLHGNQITWLKSALWYIERLLESQASWWDFERETLFPQLTHLTDPSADLNVHELNHSLRKLDKTHRQIQHLTEKILTVSSDLRVNEFACSTLHILVSNLRHYFEALSSHIQLEKEELLPEVRRKLQ